MQRRSKLDSKVKICKVPRRGMAASSDKLIASLAYLTNVENLVRTEMSKPNSNFLMANEIPFHELTPAIVEREVVQKGLPIVVTGVCKNNWNRELFSWHWLKENFGNWEMISSPRDTQSLEDLTGWNLGQYIDYMLSPPQERKRHLYGKDITCPEPWKQYMSEHLSPYFCYMPRDLVSNLKKEQQPETLMVYCGVADTYTPGHTDICGSLGHNLMVYAEKDAYALWFVARSQDKDKAAKLWGKYGAALDHDNCFLPVEKLAEADFPIHIIRQHEGDLVFVPPEGAHQVINKDGMSIKIAWNIITPSTIGTSYNSVLPLYHQICKAEVYRIKTLCLSGLQHRIEMVNSGKFEDILADEMASLIKLFNQIVKEEWVSKKALATTGENLQPARFADPIPHLRTCNFCNSDIFNRCYRCPLCRDDYDICLQCIAEGRGCIHNPRLQLMEHIPMRVIKELLEEGRRCYVKLMKHLALTPEEIPKYRLQKKVSYATLAYNMVQKYKSTEVFSCHQCKKQRPVCFMVSCTATECQKVYCAMCLWNRYAIHQVEANRNKEWKCPFCAGQCNCKTCQSANKNTNSSVGRKELSKVFKTLTDIAVVVPPAFLRHTDSIPGVCDVAPKPSHKKKKKKKRISTKSEAGSTEDKKAPQNSDEPFDIRIHTLFEDDGSYSGTDWSENVNSDNSDDESSERNETEEKSEAKKESDDSENSKKERKKLLENIYSKKYNNDSDSDTAIDIDDDDDVGDSDNGEQQDEDYKFEEEENIDDMLIEEDESTRLEEKGITTTILEKHTKNDKNKFIDDKNNKKDKLNIRTKEESTLNQLAQHLCLPSQNISLQQRHFNQQQLHPQFLAQHQQLFNQMHLQINQLQQQLLLVQQQPVSEKQYLQLQQQINQQMSQVQQLQELLSQQQPQIQPHQSQLPHQSHQTLQHHTHQHILHQTPTHQKSLPLPIFQPQQSQNNQSPQQQSQQIFLLLQQQQQARQSLQPVPSLPQSVSQNLLSRQQSSYRTVKTDAPLTLDHNTNLDSKKRKSKADSESEEIPPRKKKKSSENVENGDSSISSAGIGTSAPQIFVAPPGLQQQLQRSQHQQPQDIQQLQLQIQQQLQHFQQQLQGQKQIRKQIFQPTQLWQQKLEHSKLNEVKPAVGVKREPLNTSSASSTSLDNGSSVLTFSRSNVSYNDWIAVYESRCQRPSRVLSPSGEVYWCACGLLWNTLEEYRRHVDACEIHLICSSPPLEKDDPRFVENQTGKPATARTTTVPGRSHVQNVMLIPNPSLPKSMLPLPITPKSHADPYKATKPEVPLVTMKTEIEDSRSSSLPETERFSQKQNQKQSPINSASAIVDAATPTKSSSASNTAPKCSGTKSATSEFEPSFSRALWVKWRGFPWWPSAEICNSHELPPQVLQCKPSANAVLVFFFNEWSSPYGWCDDSSKIVKFEEFYPFFMQQLEGNHSQKQGAPQLFPDQNSENKYKRDILGGLGLLAVTFGMKDVFARVNKLTKNLGIGPNDSKSSGFPGCGNVNGMDDKQNAENI